MRSLFGNLHTPSSFSPLTGLPPGRTARGGGVFWFVVCVLAGGLQAASLAWPWHGWRLPGIEPGQASGWLQIVSLALLVLSLRHAHQVGQAVWRGWVFATVWLAGSFWWLYVSMHTYGGLAAWMPPPTVACTDLSIWMSRLEAFSRPSRHWRMVFSALTPMEQATRTPVPCPLKSGPRFRDPRPEDRGST